MLLAADEIQTGFCRTGDWFACDHEGVVPDLMTTAKALAGGMPLAAVTGRADLMEAVHPGGLGGTYGGNPVACAAALAAIDMMGSADLAAAARRIGRTVLAKTLQAAAGRPPGRRRCPGPGGDDGHGDRDGREPRSPDPDATRRIARACHQAGVSSSPAAATATSSACCPAGHRGGAPGRGLAVTGLAVDGLRAAAVRPGAGRPSRPSAAVGFDPQPWRVRCLSRARRGPQRWRGGSAARAEARPASRHWISWSASRTRSRTRWPLASLAEATAAAGRRRPPA